jgi:thiamine-phosphate pyrophosphorylase
LSDAPARCQLYLVAPDDPAPDFASTLAAVLEAVEVACLRLPARAEVGELVRLAQGRGVAAVIQSDIALAGALGADGVHLADLAQFAAARQALGPQAIIGVHCGRSRHLAMEAAEAGADYVGFDSDLDLVRWWAEIMVVPVVTELGADLATALDQASGFAAAGADFVAMGGALWRDLESAPAAARRLADAIATQES